MPTPKEILQAEKRVFAWVRYFNANPKTFLGFFLTITIVVTTTLTYKILKSSYERELANMKEIIRDLKAERQSDKVFYENRKNDYEEKIRKKDSIIEARTERERNELLQRLNISQNGSRIRIKAK